MVLKYDGLLSACKEKYMHACVDYFKMLFNYLYFNDLIPYVDIGTRNSCKRPKV